MTKPGQLKTIRRTLANLEELHEMRKNLEEFRREWLRRVPATDRFCVTAENEKDSK